jgi:hypothetical protein
MPRRALTMIVLAAAGVSDASPRTTITVWAAAPPPPPAYGGVSYGGYAPPSGALISEQREVDMQGGEVRVSGVAATIEPASVQLRDLTDPTGTSVREQRFVPGAITPDEILARHLGDPITVVTAKGELAGTLRAIDAQALVIEIGSGDQRHLQVLRRELAQDVRLPAGASADKPSLVWRLAAKKPGKHSVEITYRADGMSWTADYLAILDDAQKTIDFSAWATIKNATGASYDEAEVVLVSGGVGGPQTNAVTPYVSAPQRMLAPPQRFAVPTPVKIGTGEAVQVELLKPRVGAKARSVVTFEAMPDPSPGFQAYPGVDCNQWNATTSSTGRAEVAIELDVPTTAPLPDGRVRMFKRKGERLEVVSEDQLRSSAGVARIRLAPDTEVTGERHAVQCTYDERARTIHEKVEVKLENKSKQPVDVVVREFLWRWPMWHIDAADESVKGARAGTQTQEYRVAVPAGGKKSLTYGVSYSW